MAVSSANGAPFRAPNSAVDPPASAIASRLQQCWWSSARTFGESARPAWQAFLIGMVRAAVDAVARATAGSPRLAKVAGPVEIAGAAGALGSGMASLVAAALARANARRPNAQDLLAAAITFPEDVAHATGQPLLVFADEFQHLVDLAAYPPFDGGRRRPVEEAQRALLQVFRAHVERQPRVGWVVSGSAVRLMQRILRDGPLMGRFDELAVGPFDPGNTADLALAIWDEIGVEATDSAVERVFRLAQGHPFYADVVCRDAAVASLRLDQPVSASMVDGAFVDAVRRPNGAIAITAREMYDSLGQRAPNLREVLHVLAREEPASIAEIAERAQVASPALAYRHVQELAELGFLRDVAERAYAFTDPVFRYWVAVAYDPLAAEPVLLEPEAARRAALVYCVCRTDRRFRRRGRGVRAAGRGGIRRPVRRGHGLAWRGGRRAKRADAGDIERATRKAAFLRRAHKLPQGPTWFVSVSGFTDAARAHARDLGVYTSDLRDLEALRNVATRRA